MSDDRDEGYLPSNGIPRHLLSGPLRFRAFDECPPRSDGIRHFVGPAPFEMNRDHPHIIGMTAQIDYIPDVREMLFRVVGVERHPLPKPIADGELIGLLVKPLEQER